MRALALHRRGVEALKAGRAGDASLLFGDAFVALDRFLADPLASSPLQARAALIPEWSGSGDSLVREFLDHLGPWIAEWHFELYYTALIDRQLSLARLHWQLLQLADRLPALTRSAQLALRRDMICQRLQLNNVTIEEASTSPPTACRNADLVLNVDPLNTTARSLAVSGYSRYAQHIVENNRRQSKRRRVAGQGLCRPGLRRQLRLATRILNRHLTAGRAGMLEQDVVSHGYASLAHFHVMLGDPDKALKMLRRARRLKPGDRDLAQLRRSIRGMPRTR